MTYRLGTRKSLLATTQSNWVAQQVHASLVGVETEGDRIIDIPLRQAEGRNFFVKELDDALLSEKVDLVVHSYKDLSLDRPDGIAPPFIPAREDPRDIVLFSEKILEKLSLGQVIRLGTSSPRRLAMIPPFLKLALPRFHGEPKIECVEIRGNVNTRLKRLDSDLDGVVLALAGLNRLLSNERARSEMLPMVSRAKKMIIPLMECPAAPAQGALAVESLAKNLINQPALKDSLEALHHKHTSDCIAAERAILKEWGGGCHLELGATCVQHSELGKILIIKGRRPNGEWVDELRYDVKPCPSKGLAWNGMDDVTTLRDSLDHFEIPSSAKAPIAYFAHFQAYQAYAFKSSLPKDSRIWVSGMNSWKKFAAAGVWVEGSSEGMGLEWISKTLNSPVLDPHGDSQRFVVTHRDAHQTWDNRFEKVIPYRVQWTLTAEQEAKIKQAKFLYWGSASQFRSLRNLCDPEAIHCCGAGKTAALLREMGVADPVVFPNVREWKKWLSN